MREHLATTPKATPAVKKEEKKEREL